MKTTPPKGMNDYLPAQAALRSALKQTILNTYLRYGFSQILTPALEDAENLQKSDGGENLNLIYQVMKRGAKLENALSQGLPLWDLGLRYDLTLPLSRYYAANRAKLPSPFKAIQIGRAYRAERPQKGRLRELTQCDIDIIGDSSMQAELELIAVTAQALLAAGLSGFTVRLSHRGLLGKLLAVLGFAPAETPAVCIALDKLDKIGQTGVLEELSAKGLPSCALGSLGAFLAQGDLSLEAVLARTGPCPQGDEASAILAGLARLGEGQWDIRFDLTVVRGQGYYTGPVFEIAYPGYPGSIAGGGRYDGLIEKFTGAPTPAVGFSIGFERIAAIVGQQGLLPPAPPRLALLYPSGIPFDSLFRKARQLSQDYQVTLLPLAPKQGKQRARLAREGYGLTLLWGEDQPSPLAP